VRIRDGGGELEGRWFRSMFRKGWGTGHILFSGLTPGWMGILCERDLGACLIWRRPNYV
jgi:hypothetical protein